MAGVTAALPMHPSSPSKQLHTYRDQLHALPSSAASPTHHTNRKTSSSAMKRPLEIGKPGIRYYVWKDAPENPSHSSIPLPPLGSPSVDDSVGSKQGHNERSGSKRRATNTITNTFPSTSPTPNLEEHYLNTPYQSATFHHVPSTNLEADRKLDMTVEDLRNFVFHQKESLRSRLKYINKRKRVSQDNIQEIKDERSRLPYSNPFFKHFSQLELMDAATRKKWEYAIKMYQEYEDTGRLHRIQETSTSSTPIGTSRTYRVKSASIWETIQRMKGAVRHRTQRAIKSGLVPNEKDVEQFKLLSDCFAQSMLPNEQQLMNLPVQQQALWESIFQGAEANDAKDEEKTPPKGKQ